MYICMYICMYIYVYIMACRAGLGPEEGRAGLAALTAPQHIWRFAKSCGWIIYSIWHVWAGLGPKERSGGCLQRT